MTDETISLREYVERRFIDLDRLHAQTQSAASAAVIKAEEMTWARIDKLNDLHRVLTDERQKTMSRIEYAAYHEALSKRVSDLEAVRSEMTGRDRATSRVSSLVLSLAAILVAALSLIWHR